MYVCVVNNWDLYQLNYKNRLYINAIWNDWFQYKSWIDNLSMNLNNKKLAHS